MKASEHMRLGSMLQPQGFNKLFTEDGSSCAIGAIMQSSGIADSLAQVKFEVIVNIHATLRATFPILAQHPQFLPPGMAGDLDLLYGPRLTVQQTIIFLNNIARWPREQIADYLEKLEEAAEVQAAGATLKQGEYCEA